MEGAGNGALALDLARVAQVDELHAGLAVQRTRHWSSLPVASAGHNRVVIAHGPTSAELMDHLPPEGGVLLFRPLGTQHPVGFEYLASIEPRHWPALLRQLPPL